jgi:RNA polymerase sigma-70 factor (ECF subfamily)
VVAPEGFASFYRDEYARVVLYVRKLGGNEKDAEDSAQEAMIQALQAWDRLTAPRAWVRRAAFTCYVRKANRRRSEASLLEWSVGTDEDYRSPSPELRDKTMHVIELIRKLPMEQRKVAALFYDGFTHEEIAEILGKTNGNVRSLLRHARLRLKEVIQSQAASMLDTMP